MRRRKYYIGISIAISYATSGKREPYSFVTIHPATIISFFVPTLLFVLTTSQAKPKQPQTRESKHTGSEEEIQLGASGALEQETNGGPHVRGDRAPARPARRQQRGRGGGRRGEELRQEGLRRDHRPRAEAGASVGCRAAVRGRRGSGRWCRGGAALSGCCRRAVEAVAEPVQRGHHRAAGRRPREAARAQGAGGGVAAGAVVPEEHAGGGGGERGGGAGEGEHGRRALPAQGGHGHLQELPGAVQGPGEDVQLLHHRQRMLSGSGDDGHEREQAGGPAQRLRLRAHLRGQGRRLDARRRRPLGDVRRVLQAPPDNERIRSHRPSAKGNGEMQEQELIDVRSVHFKITTMLAQLCTIIYYCYFAMIRSKFRYRLD